MLAPRKSSVNRFTVLLRKSAALFSLDSKVRTFHMMNKNLMQYEIEANKTIVNRYLFEKKPSYMLFFSQLKTFFYKTFLPFCYHKTSI